MSEYKEKILHSLLTKSSTKQFIFRNTSKIYDDFRNDLKLITSELSDKISKADPNVLISYKDDGQFETQIQLSGDVLLFAMHSNVFNFDDGHFIHKLPYVQEDPLRAYCGMIEIYNFLSDSLKYQRLNDLGYLVGRIFINKDNHFFVDGKGQMSFLYNDFANMVMTPELMRNIIETSIFYALELDLWAPNINDVLELTVAEKITQAGLSIHRTGKRAGFNMSYLREDNHS